MFTDILSALLKLLLIHWVCSRLVSSRLTGNDILLLGFILPLYSFAHNSRCRRDPGESAIKLRFLAQKCTSLFCRLELDGNKSPQSSSDPPSPVRIHHTPLDIFSHLFNLSGCEDSSSSLTSKPFMVLSARLGLRLTALFDSDSLSLMRLEIISSRPGKVHYPRSFLSSAYPS